MASEGLLAGYPGPHPFAQPLAAVVEWLQGERGRPLPLNSSSPGLENTRVAKIGTGFLLGLTVYSNNVAAQFIHLFDLSAVPANGTIPALVLRIAATSTGTLTYMPLGRTCFEGIIFTNSTTAGSLTLGAADCFFDVQFI